MMALSDDVKHLEDRVVIVEKEMAVFRSEMNMKTNSIENEVAGNTLQLAQFQESYAGLSSDIRYVKEHIADGKISDRDKVKNRIATISLFLSGFMGIGSLIIAILK
jgi:hypothetical protein